MAFPRRDPDDAALAQELVNASHGDSWFGGKTIGFVSGVALLINNITGPGVPQLPNLFAEAGWLTPTMCFIAIWLMTSLSTAMYAEAMRRIPGNEHFRDRIEYTSIVRFYFGPKAYKLSQIGLNGALQSLNIVSVIQSAQVMDSALSAVFGESCALNLTPFANYNVTHVIQGSESAWTCTDTTNYGAVGGNPWGCHVVLTGGFLLTMAMAIPMGFFNLDDNMIVQVVAFVLTLGCWGVWIAASASSDAFIPSTQYPGGPGADFKHGWHIPMVNTDPQTGSQTAVLGTILFNFGFVTTVPSWINEKKPSVSVNRTVWLSTALCNVIFFAVGLTGAMAFAPYLQGPASNACAKYGTGNGCAGSVMSLFTGPDAPKAWSSSKELNWLLQFSVYLFPVVAIVSSIPVFSIVIKYNCIENGFSRTFAFCWGVLFPWLFALPLLYQPNALNQFINFSSLIFVSFTDFIVPWALYYTMVQREATKSRIENQGLINSDLLTRTRSNRLVVHEHYAIPPSWGVGNKTKVGLSKFLVVVMALCAAAGSVLTVVQGNFSFDCAGVGS